MQSHRIPPLRAVWAQWHSIVPQATTGQSV